MRKLLLLFIFLLILPTISAKELHMKLLAVTERGDELEGSPADLYLSIIPGNGGVFIETFPLTKFDTQISTRFAKEMACSYIDVDCDVYDFIYTIRARSGIIGGPSASAAVTILTIAGLKDLELDDKLTITGTINSGGLIGPVGGLKEKIEAAAKINLSKVLIPKGERFIKEGNLTYDLKDHADKYGVEIKEVSELGEALYEFSGFKLEEVYGNITISEEYENTMRNLAVLLCDRSSELEKDVKAGNKTIKEDALNLTERADNSFKKGAYYSAASYCFGANLKYRYLILKEKGVGKGVIENLEKNIRKFNERIDKKELKTITDLQAYMVVKERLIEAEDYLENAKGLDSKDEDFLNNLAYAIERLFSAESWAYFFDKGGKEFVLNNEVLEKSCTRKLAEAEERYLYVKSFFPGALSETRKELDYAYDDFDNKAFHLCLFKASKAKAEANLVLSAMGFLEEQVGELLESKLEIVRKTIAKHQDTFPILGYSYYEYANSLKETEPYSALLYLEYALELSDLDLYFKEKKISVRKIDGKYILIFFIGFLVGVGFVLLVKKKPKPKRKK